MSSPSWTQSDPAQMAERLQSWARAACGPGAEVRDVERMPGHSGISYAFTLVTDGYVEPLVIRVPPLGVKQQGVTDVLRQVPLLELLAEHDLPVPRVRFSGADERWFGTAYLVVERVAGAMPGDIFAGTVPAPTAAERDALFARGMAVLARIHAVDTDRLPDGWSEPADLPALADHWLALLDRCERPELQSIGKRVRDRLHATAPEPEPRPGLVHGDFYQNNWMVADGALTAVLDWESGHLGPGLIDVGYIAMMYDPESWDPALRTDLVDQDRPEFLLDRYAEYSGTPLRRAAWFRALAGLRLGALTAYFVRLHRTGRRPDATWDAIGPSAPFILERAAAVLDAPT